MDRRPSDRILEEWDAVSRDAPRPAGAPYRARVRGSFRAASLAPLLAAALIVAVGIAWLGSRESGVGGNGSPTPGAPSSTPSSPAVTPSGVADACRLEVAITSWEGAAGSRLANLVATNTGQIACEIPLLTPAQLIDGTGRVLAETPAPASDSRLVSIEPGQRATAMASVSNVCGAPPVAPVTIRLDLATNGVVDARPASPTDTTVPPCNGPGQPSLMSMQEWAR